MKIGFIGLGNMGIGMAANILAAGHQLVVNDLEAKRSDALLEKGAAWADTPKAVAAESEIVFTSLPGPEEVREGVMAARVAAHAADLARGVPSALEWDRRMSEARKALDWSKQIELSIDPDKAKAMWEKSGSPGEETCTMCGDYCAILKVKEYFGQGG